MRLFFILLRVNPLIQRTKHFIKKQGYRGVVALVHIDVVYRMFVGYPVQGFERETVEVEMHVVDGVDL